MGRGHGARAVVSSLEGADSMKAMVRDLTKKLGIYKALRRVSDAVKWSRTFDYLYDLTHPETHRLKQGELALLRSQVPAASLCFDVGANIGDKTGILLQHRCSVVSVEPIKRNIEILKKRYGRNANVTIVPAAMSDHVGRETINITDDALAFSTFSQKWVDALEDEKSNRWGIAVKTSTDVVETNTLDALLDQFGVPYYIKIDVEGHEINVLRGLTRKIQLISFEANLPEFLEETRACVSHLLSLDPSAVFNYTGENQTDFELRTWVDATALGAILDKGELRFMEIYCRTTPT
jgi:FkbM family methyltransferase